MGKRRKGKVKKRGAIKGKGGAKVGREKMGKREKGERSRKRNEGWGEG